MKINNLTKEQIKRLETIRANPRRKRITMDELEKRVFFLVALKEKIRQAQAEGKKMLFFVDLDGVERVYLFKNGEKWLENATLDDILRVSPR